MPFGKINAHYGDILEIVMISLPGKTYSVKFSFLFKKVRLPWGSIALLWMKKGILVVCQDVQLEDMEVHLTGMKGDKNCNGESRIFAQ